MNLSDIIHRGTPQPWVEADNLSWNEPEFSARMLHEHLSQAHDAASRRAEVIDQHVDFIHHRLLEGRSGRVLDLGCGPGLYAVRMARLGHSVRGIDFSPASIAYARQQSNALDCVFELEDVRKADYGQGYDLVMFIYGEFNVFRREQGRAILEKAFAALKPGGLLLLEPSTAEATRAIADEPREWSANASGLFSPRPHLMLGEAFWDEPAQVAIKRYYVVDAETGAVERFSSSYVAYTPDELRDLLCSSGYTDVCFYPSLSGDVPSQGFYSLTARRPQ